MDREWTKSWQPSAVAGMYTATQDDVPKLRQELSQCTKTLKERPHSMDAWFKRSDVLRTLGYPELAVGDAYKALLLLENGHNKSMTVNAPPALRRQQAQVRLHIVECLRLCRAIIDARDFYRVTKDKYLAEVIAVDEDRDTERRVFEDIVEVNKKIPQDWPKEERDGLLSVGHLKVRHYPWMTAEQTQRSDALLKQVAWEMEIQSGKRAMLQKSHIRGDADKDVWGVAATKEMKSNQDILRDSVTDGVLAVLDIQASRERGIIGRCQTCCVPLPLRGAVPGPCKVCSYCSEQCLEIAKKSFHALICPTNDFNFPKLHKGVPPGHFVRLSLFGKCLGTVAGKVDRKQDPLQHPFMSRLTPNVDGPESHAFNYHDHIIYPNQMLQKMGIDIFADSRWDTWVLMTMRRRLDNNAHGELVHGLYPYFAMFNHSCEPSVVVEENEDGAAALTLRTLRPIMKNEELTIAYKEDEGATLGHRRYGLYHWLGCDCKCVRCVREEMQAIGGG